jgi:hypothetical protein
MLSCEMNSSGHQERLMQWDSIKTAQKFLLQANALHPDKSDGGGRYEDELARQELFYECYMCCFTKERLTELLHAAISGNFKIPKEVEVDEAKYRTAYAQQARVILADLEK